MKKHQEEDDKNKSISKKKNSFVLPQKVTSFLKNENKKKKEIAKHHLENKFEEL